MEKNEISSLQKYIWLDQKINPHSPKYNIGGYAIINSCIDFKLFKKAVSLFARKHTGIKNVFQQDGGIPFSFIHKEDTYEGIHCFEENNKQKLIDLIRRDFKVPFNIENHKRLFKIWLVKLNPNTTVWYTKLHHLIADGYSFKLLFNEISIIYNSLKGAAVDFDSSIYKQFNDHVIEEKEYYNSNALEKDKEFWKLKYPEFPRLIYNISTQANAFYSKEWYLCKNSLNKLQLVCQNENVSVFNILLAAFSLVLSKFYFTEEINIGTPILNRLSKTDRQIFGPFINLLPLQIHLTNNVSFLGLIKQIKRDMFNTLRHQRFQQAELIKAISFQGNRLYDVRISYENFNYQNQFSNYDTEIVALSNNSEEDPISVHIMDYNSEGLKFRFDIAGSFVPEYIADEFIESLGQILENTPDLLKENIHSISITTEKQIEEMKAISVGAIRTDEVNSFSELWNKNLQYFSSNEAVIYKKNRLTYAEIGKKVKKVSEYLLYKGIKKGERIGVLLDRSVDVIPVILGVLESGATYVPIEKSFPKSRKEYIIEDSTIELLLVDDETSQFDCECLPLTTIFNARIPLISDDILITPEDEAYIIYTSGSMGKPKGVSIKHESLIDYTITFSKYFDLDVSDRIIQQSSFVFDTSIEEIFPVLSVGGTLVISDNPKDFHTLCQECSVNNITLLSTNPYVVQYLNTNYEDYGLSLKTIISGGDMLKREQVINLLGKVDIYNTYGPTESTVCATYHRIAPNDIALPIGKPIANRKVFIVSNNDLLPKGALGEIVLAGKGLANGYINRNLLTESLFVEIERERVYKTGDLGKWDEKGNLFFYGRKDNQLSFRGYRIEPLEVEETIKSIDSTIINCHVTIKEILNTPALIAYILNDNEVINSSSLRKKLQKILPTYMVPNHLVHLKEFPLSANGKIDSKRLPIPKVSEVGKEMALASTIIEKEITQIWNNILNLTEIDIHTSFFELGGHSLLANQFIAILRKNRKQDISLREFYKSPTIHEIAKILESKEISLSFQLQKAPIQELYPLSYPQERIWFLNQLNRENKAYYVPRAIRIFGKLDVSIIEKTFTLLIEKHEILRTVFIEKDGIPYQKVLLPHKFHIPLTSLEGLSVKEQEIEIQDFILRKGNLSFDLEKGPLLRAYILKRGKKDSILIFCEHHLIHDGWTQGILLREFIETYSELIRNPNFSISKPELQFKDFSYWQKEFFNDERLDTHLSFWKEKLKGHIPVLELPQKNKRPKEISGNGELLVRTVSNELSDKIRTFSLENNATSFITMLAAFKTTLSRFSNETDICVGTTVANRRLASLNKMLGMVINTIALRTKFGRSDSLRSIFEKCGETCFEAYGYEDTPFGKVVESVAPKRSLGSMPIFQYLFSFMNTPSRNLFLPNLELEILDSHNRSAKFDINVVVVTPLEQAMQEGVTESNRAIIVEWEYNSDIYSEDTMQLMLDMYFANLEALVSTPDIPFMDIDCEGLVQEREFLEHINATSFEYPKDTTIIELFETQVTKTPYNTALVFEEYELTYLELNELANQLADYLNQNCKPQPDQLIAIQLERNQWMVTAILAVLKTGAAYLPIDPEYPEGRIRYMLRDSQAKGIINQEFLSTFIDQKEQYTKEDIPNKATENNLAYVIYTSGSTGKPKGVMIEHKSLTNFITSMTHLLDINVNSKLISTTTYAFDIFYLELFSPLVVGGTTILSKSIHKLNPDYLKLLISKYQPSHIQATPTTWKLLTEQGWENEEKTTIISGGEAIQDSLKNALTKLSQSKVWNLYGPTETTIWSTAQTLKFNQKVNIGTPIANTQIYILDNNLNRLPKGVAGELCISGDGLARGYLNRPELNKEKFISNPFKAGHKLYKTGDLCRWLPDGNIEFLGRKDNQVKIRGHRIELGEIENTILELDQIKQCVVLVKEDVQNKDLLAYYTCEETFDKDSIRTSLSQSLPTYMVPNHFINLEDLPLTPNGKIDKKALPDPQTMQLSGGTEYVAPRTEKEQQLVDIWEEVLDRENIGVKDDFFELGGHSLKMMRLVSSYHKKLNVRIHLSDLFIHTSLESHTGLLAKADQSEHIAIPLVPVNEENSYPVSDAQRRLWVLSQFDGGSIPYNMPGSMVLDGSYDVDSFTRAIYSVLERHEILRTVFREKKSGEVRQFILDRADLGFDIEYKDYRSAKDSKERVREYIEGDSYKEFDLESGPLLRSALLHVEDDKYIFYYNMHHIISDGWSKGVLSRDVLRYYNLYLKGEESAIPGLRIQYKDYACWQLSQLEEESFAVHRNYWLDTLSGEIPLLDLPSKKKRPKLKTNNGHALSTYINADVTRKLLRFSRENNGSLFMSLLATWNVLMYRYTSQKDIIIGSPIAGREHTDLKDQIGFYVNTLVFRNQVDPEQSFTSFYKGVIKTTLTGFSHQAYPFDRLVEDLDVRKDPSRSAVFDIMLILQNNGEKTEGFHLNVNHINQIADEGSRPSKFDLLLNFQEQGDVIAFTVEYNTDVYERDMVEMLIKHYKALLISIMLKPEEQISNIDYLSQEEKTTLISSFNDTKFEYLRDKSIVDLFEEQVLKGPNDISLVLENDEIEYEELNELANQIAHFLLNEVKLLSEEKVGVMLHPSFWSIASIIGILKAGGAYVPLDPSLPEQRLKYMLDETETRALITEKNFIEKANRLQWTSNRLQTYLCVDTLDVFNEKEKEDNLLMEQKLWDHIGERSEDQISGGGWISSYTGIPLSTIEMEEYSMNVFKKLVRILHSEMRVLEIGCSSGLTLHKIAPEVAFYYGIDLSPIIISKLSNHLENWGFKNVKLKQLQAHEISQIKEDSFDLIIINSVIQYFHGHNYLRKVINDCVELMKDNGQIFIGDVMDINKRDDLISDLKLFKLENKNFTTKTEFSSELFVSRNFFKDLVIDYSHVCGVSISDKIYTIENELTKFRYDVILEVDKKNKKSGNQTKKKRQYSQTILKNQSKLNPDLTIQSNNLLNIIYTSGSTGKPKGVMTTHSSLVSFLTNLNQSFGFTKGKRIAATTNMSFDIFGLEVFGSLCNGCELVLFSDKDLMDPLAFMDRIHECKVEVLQLTPSRLLQVYNSGVNFSLGLKFLLVAGEALSYSLYERLKQESFRSCNSYGPTETTIYSTSLQLKESTFLSIGKPLNNEEIYILDQNNMMQPIGVIGEICIGGEGLARGYLNRPDLTSEKFVLNPFKSGERMYRTGDLGRWLEDGNVEFIGRNDDQVKIRGYRIELGEIEHALLSHEAIDQAIVMARDSVGSGDKELIAYLISKSCQNTVELRSYLSERLPSYMVPSHFVKLDAFPLTSNGKVDRKGFPSPDGLGIDSGVAYVAPRNEIEEQLVKIWEELFGKEKIGVKDDFFELGGHSLKMMRLVSSYHKAFNIKVDLGDLFTHTSLESHTGLLAKEDLNEHFAIAPVPASDDNGYPISDAQRRLWVLAQFEGGSVAYNMPGSMPLDGSY
ncbi:MAG: amino acid adenylation domain-containing protein, partial [Bacteroidota bacterium]